MRHDAETDRDLWEAQANHLYQANKRLKKQVEELTELSEHWIGSYYTLWKTRLGQMTESEYRSFMARGYDQLRKINDG